MKSKRSLEGYLMVDNRCSGGGMIEGAVLTCVHCHAQIQIDPLRSRALIRCFNCDAYVCENGKCNRECNGSLVRVLDKLQEKTARGILF